MTVAARRPKINGALGIAVFVGERANEVAVVFFYLNIGGYPLAEKPLRLGQRVNAYEQVSGVVGIKRLAKSTIHEIAQTVDTDDAVLKVLERIECRDFNSRGLFFFFAGLE
jgi:hypothetical protein